LEILFPGGYKIPRKSGPGITQSDLLVINKTDVAKAVGADLKLMERDTLKMRGDGPFVFAPVKHAWAWTKSSGTCFMPGTCVRRAAWTSPSLRSDTGGSPILFKLWQPPSQVESVENVESVEIKEDARAVSSTNLLAIKSY
jgi:hypothetical protein